MSPVEQLRAGLAGLRAEPKARFRKGRSEWLELEFHSDEDVAHLLALAREACAAARQHRA